MQGVGIKAQMSHPCQGSVACCLRDCRTDFDTVGPQVLQKLSLPITNLSRVTSVLKSLTSRVLPKIRRFDTCHLRSILCGSFGLRMQSHTTAQDLEERANGTQVLESGLESLWALVLATACALVWVLVSGTQANEKWKSRKQDCAWPPCIMLHAKGGMISNFEEESNRH